MYQDKKVENEQILFIGEEEYWELRSKAEVADVLEKLFEKGYFIANEDVEMYEKYGIVETHCFAENVDEMFDYYFTEYGEKVYQN